MSIHLRNTDGSFCRYMTSSEVSTGLEKKTIKRITTSKKKGQAAFVYQMVQMPEPLRTIEEFSAPSITVGDMLANAGLSDSPGHVYVAREKVKEFGKFRFRATPMFASLLEASTPMAVAFS